MSKTRRYTRACEDCSCQDDSVTRVEFSTFSKWVCPHCALMYFDTEEYRVHMGEIPKWMEEELPF